MNHCAIAYRENTAASNVRRCSDLAEASAGWRLCDEPEIVEREKHAIKIRKIIESYRSDPGRALRPDHRNGRCSLVNH